MRGLLFQTANAPVALVAPRFIVGALRSSAMNGLLLILSSLHICAIGRDECCLIFCQGVTIEVNTLPGDVYKLVIALYGSVAFLGQLLRQLGILYHAAQGLGHLCWLLRLYQQAVDAIGNNILAAAHSGGDTGDTA